MLSSPKLPFYYSVLSRQQTGKKSCHSEMLLLLFWYFIHQLPSLSFLLVFLLFNLRLVFMLSALLGTFLHYIFLEGGDLELFKCEPPKGRTAAECIKAGWQCQLSDDSGAAPSP